MFILGDKHSWIKFYWKDDSWFYLRGPASGECSIQLEKNTFLEALGLSKG